MNSLKHIGRIVTIAVLVIAANVYASADYYLKIDGIKGERARIVRCSNGQCTVEDISSGDFTVTVCDSRGNPIGDNFKLTCTFTPTAFRESPTKSSAELRESPTKASTGVGTTSIATEIVSPRDAASGLPTGKRMHKPVVVTKEIDKASPVLKLDTPSGEENQTVVHWQLEVRVDRIVMK